MSGRIAESFESSCVHLISQTAAVAKPFRFLGTNNIADRSANKSYTQRRNLYIKKFVNLEKSVYLGGSGRQGRIDGVPKWPENRLKMAKIERIKRREAAVEIRELACDNPKDATDRPVARISTGIPEFEKQK